MKYLLFLFLVLMLPGCIVVSGDWKLILKNGQEIDWPSPYAIRDNIVPFCADYSAKEDYSKDYYTGAFFIDKRVMEKVRYYGHIGKVVRYYKGKRDEFYICSEEAWQLSYDAYLKNKYGEKP